MDDETIREILGTRAIAVDAIIKARCQDLIIQQLKRDKDRLESELKILVKKVEKYETDINVKHELEVKLTSERDVLKESLKRTQFDLEKQTKKVDLEFNKRQKMRKSYGILNKSIQSDDSDVLNALNDLREGLMN
jgi:peptidoglycan hydrolase CwlO-like protein